MYRRLLRRSIIVAFVLAVGGLGFAVIPDASAAQLMLNVRDFGATGNGTSNDTGAINKAITAANNNPDGRNVRLPPATYPSPHSIPTKHKVTLQLDHRST